MNCKPCILGACEQFKLSVDLYLLLVKHMDSLVVSLKSMNFYFVTSICNDIHWNTEIYLPISSNFQQNRKGHKTTCRKMILII